MYIANDEHGVQILAHNAVKSGRYFCPVCETPVVLKAGSIKVPHFSHHHILQCSRYLYKRESLLHLKLKHDLYLELNRYYATAMEYYLESIEQIPDLLIERDLALEIQLSRISPELILSRTEGYYKLGMRVMWLLDQKEIKTEGQYIYLNHFQLSTMTNDNIYTVNTETLAVTAWHIGHTAGLNRFTYKKEQVDLNEILTYKSTVEWEETYTLAKSVMKHLIQREKAKKSVLNPTLTYMYQLEMTVDTFPEFLYITSFDERYILNSPVEWKLYIYYHLSNDIFELEKFSDFIKLRNISNIPDKKSVVQSLLMFYLKVFRISKDIT
ncbi:competence protein CoiA [Jeotgalicoccus coquinae]|uniref:Competence protein CoiA n=1 Tax=Jeotgalicoccus coquinae TaxID=709509 RepID=A0A6V7RKR4_9STAP|nr:competence protein CoiA family protein [Jeotgalicoccus coquinae]MBB6422406.1 competence protein CoiA [Jeotgalicoccus coquinae]GGE16075.1 competence protein CoiA [Jeotgalicoccus coquinae]CAD2078697.1 Competence protein CoiA-like family protein [Jeotgalicoccus coquinae]